MNDRNVRTANPRQARHIQDDGKPRTATVAELRDAQALISKHAIALLQNSLAVDNVDQAMASGMYAVTALALAGSIRKEFGEG